MANILEEVDGIYQYMWNDSGLSNWVGMLKREPENKEINEEEFLLRNFNNMVLSKYDMDHEEYDFNKKKEIRKNEEMNILDKKLNEEIKMLQLLNSNFQCLSYYKPNQRNKLQFVKNKKKTGYDIIDIVINKNYDNKYYMKKIKEIISAIEFKKKV